MADFIITNTEGPTPINITITETSRGPAGIDGADGADGADGLSAYEVAVQNGFVGTEEEWLASLVGPAGPNVTIDGSDADKLLASPNPKLQIFIDRLKGASFDLTRFDRRLHDQVFAAAGETIDDCYMLLLDKGAFEVVRPEATVTISIATPAVVTWTAHGLYPGDPVVFETTGALPTGIVAGQTYYVSTVSNLANSFTITSTPFGAQVATSGSQSGTHTAERTRTDITRWVSADPLGNDATPIELSYISFAPRGFPLRPFFDDEGNIRAKTSGLNSAGFYRSGNPFAGGVPTMMMFAIFKQDDPDVVFASKAAMDADLDWPAGTIAEITEKTQINAGIWIKSNPPGSGTWAKVAPDVISGPTGDQRLELGLRSDLVASNIWLDAEQQLRGTMLKTGVGTYATPFSFGIPLVGNGSHILSATYDGSNFEIWMDGVKIARSAPLTFSAFDTFSELFISRRGLSTIQAFGIWRAYDQQRFVKIHNVLADNYGLPVIDDRPVIMGFSSSGQSLAAGSTSVSDTWTTAAGWNGVVTGDRRESPSRRVIPNWLSTNGTLASGGEPVGMFISGNASVQFTMAPGGMNSDGIFFGFAEHIRSAGVPYDGWLGAWGVGGQTLSALRKPAGSRVIETLLTPVPASQYERGIRQILLAKRYAEAQGYRFQMGAFLWMHGNADATNVNYATEMLAFYDEFNADCKAITGQSNNVVMLLDACNYSTDGVVNSLAPINQRQLNVIATRGTRPIFPVAPGYQISNFIHWYARGYRWQGEQFAKAWLDVHQRTGNFTGVTPISAVRDGSSVLLTFNVPVPPLQFDTNENNIESLLTNKGFEYSGGGRTITSVELVGTTQVRINLSSSAAAGHSVAYVKGSRYGNLCDSDARTSVFRDQDWSTGIWPAPAEADGELNDLRNWAFAFEIELT